MADARRLHVLLVEDRGQTSAGNGGASEVVMAKGNTFSVDDRVTNPAYGDGTIRALDERYTTIAFDTNGTRRFLTSVVALERSDSPPPAPKHTKKARRGR